LKEFGVVKNMFKQNIKRKKSNNKLMRYKAKQKKTMECAFILKRRGCAQGRKCEKKIYTELQNTKIYRIWF